MSVVVMEAAGMFEFHSPVILSSEALRDGNRVDKNQAREQLETRTTVIYQGGGGTGRSGTGTRTRNRSNERPTDEVTC